MKSQHLFSRILIVFFSFAAASISWGATPQKIAAEAFDATVLLMMEDANGQAVSLGSGFLVDKNTIVTNYHVIEGAASGYAKLIDKERKFDIEGVTAIDQQHDLALLHVTLSGPTLNLGISDDLTVGDEVYAVGNPRGLEGTFSQGIVSSVRSIGNDTLLQITAPISPGSSGGPVLDLNANVIGVAVATYKGGQNLNFAIPSKYVRELLDKKGTIKALSSSQQSSNKRSFLHGLGGKTSEGVAGGRLSWAYKHGQSGQYSFSLKNNLRETVNNILCLVIFYDSEDVPIDVDLIHYKESIPGRLAKRVKSKVDGSVQEWTTQTGKATPDTKVEIRVLDFRIAD
jgi:S1-C subfamily serine protease